MSRRRDYGTDDDGMPGLQLDSDADDDETVDESGADDADTEILLHDEQTLTNRDIRMYLDIAMREMPRLPGNEQVADG